MTETGAPALAVPVFELALSLDPGNAAVYSNLGNALGRLGRPDEAVARYGQALAINSDHPAALSNRAAQLISLGRPGEALADLDRALGLNPRLGAAHRLRGMALFALGRALEALESIDAATLLLGQRADILLQRGQALTVLGRFAEGERDFARAAALQPGDMEYQFQHGVAALRLGRFDIGWRAYEHRWRIPRLGPQNSLYAASGLAGRMTLDFELADVAGKAVLLIDEQGVGDHIMFASMLTDLAATAGRVTCLCSPRMLGLFEASFPGIAFLPTVPGETLDIRPYDILIPMGSLGRLYRNTAADFPGVPYLRPRDAVVAEWARRLEPRSRRLRVGLSWRGGADASSRAKRSMALEALRPLLRRPDCAFVSLQYGDVADEIDAVNAGLDRPIMSFPAAQIADFEQLAGLALGLDVVVSVQTALVHLCGALGAPCLAMIPFLPEWRYGAQGERMPWYDSVTLLRQPTQGQWDPVIEAVGDRLDALAVP